MNINPVLTEESLKKLYLKEGLSTTGVARKLGASETGVRKAMIRYGIPLRSMGEAALAQPERAHVRCADWERLAERYEGGATLVDIATEVGCAWSTASARLSRYTTIRPRGSEVKPNGRGRIEIDVKAAIEANQRGETLTQIGDRLGVSVQIVSKRLKEAGYKVITHKASKEKFASVQSKRRKVAQAIGAEKCVICSDDRGVQLCHIQARRDGGPFTPDNTVALCPNHHWFFDRGTLKDSELSVLKPYLEAAAAKGYQHERYRVKQ
ncbi:MAG: hypothetical protein HKO76_08950 [Acidimicrobiia bacterium]|nr:hypothetical protein [Acidimicrobiia bacterium]